MDCKIKKILYQLAKKSFLKNNVPMSSIIVDSHNKIIAKGFNNRKTKNDITGHAEIVALRKASRKKRTWNLNNLTLITTFEPCMMCTGAILQSKIKNIIFMYDEPKFGFINSNHSLDLSKLNIKKIVPDETKYNHRKLIKDFFIKLRIHNKNIKNKNENKRGVLV